MSKNVAATRSFVARYAMSMKTKLIVIFLAVKVIPLVLLAVIAWRQFVFLGDTLR